MNRRWLRLAPLLLIGVAAVALAQDPSSLPSAPVPVDAAAVDAVADAAAAGGGLFKWAVLGVGVVSLGVLAAVGRRYAAMIALFAGLAAIFAGERLFGSGAMHWPLTGVGLIGVFASFGMRARSMASETDPSRRSAQRTGLVTAATVLVGLALYALGTEGVTSSLGFVDDAASRWRGAWTALSAVVLAAGLFPAFFVDQALAANPVVLPRGAGGRAAQAGLATAFALSLLFPLNYVARSDKYRMEVDYSYFRVTDVGDATRSIVRTLTEPVTAYLYFSPGSEVQEKALPYFNALAQSSGGQLTVEVVDAAVRPDLAEAQSVRENGWVVLARGDNTQKFKVGTELDRAERELKKLDGTVQKHLLKLVSDEHIVYWLTGHGEGSWRTRDDPLRKMALFKRAMEDLNFRVSPLGTSEGSAVAVPDDAAMVVIAAPTAELFDEEEAALEAYLDGGGAMLVMLDPGAATLTPLMTKLGLVAGTVPIANASANVPLTGRGLADRVVLATNRFGSHEAITTVARHSTEEFLVLPTAVSVTALPDSTLDHAVLVRTYPDSWEDTDGDRRHGTAEPGRVFELAQAVEPEAKDGFRAVVLGDVSVFSDYILDRSVGSADFAHDAASWLVGEADIIGGTEREEDVEIRHTHEGEAAWFWGTILGIPLLILVLGGISVNLRRRT